MQKPDEQMHESKEAIDAAPLRSRSDAELYDRYGAGIFAYLLFYTSLQEDTEDLTNDGEDLVVYTTRDAGSTWQSSPVLHRKSGSLQPSDQSFGTPQFLDMQHGWAAGSDPVLYTTTDGGQHWTQVYPGKDHSLDPLGMLDFVSAQTGWSMRHPSDQQTHTQTTVLYKTGDGGATWTQVHAIFPDFIMPASAFHE